MPSKISFLPGDAVEVVRQDADEEATDPQPRESANTSNFARIWLHIHFEDAPTVPQWDG